MAGDGCVRVSMMIGGGAKSDVSHFLTDLSTILIGGRSWFSCFVATLAGIHSVALTELCCGLSLSLMSVSFSSDAGACSKRRDCEAHELTARGLEGIRNEGDEGAQRPLDENDDAEVKFGGSTEGVVPWLGGGNKNLPTRPMFCTLKNLTDFFGMKKKMIYNRRTRNSYTRHVASSQ